MFTIGQQIYSVDFGQIGTVIASDQTGFVLALPAGNVFYPHNSDPAAFELS